MALSLAAASGSGLAQPDDDGRTGYGIGGAVLFDRDGYRGVGTETLLLPGISIRSKWINLFGPQVDFRLIGNESRSWWVGPRVEYRFDGYEVADGDVFRGMSDRKGGVFYGLASSFELVADLELELDYVRAASRDSGFERGSVGSVQLSRGFRSGAWTFVPRVGVEYLSAKYVDYYYGVRPGEATAARPAYLGRSTISPEVGLLVLWNITPRQILFANLNYERYRREIRDSPLMNANGIPQMVIGYEFILR